MSLRDDLVAQLIDHEGLRTRVYTDTVGKVSIGIGRNLTDNGISREEALILADHDIDAAVQDLATAYRWFVNLDDVRWRAVVDFRFNLGPTKFRTFRHFIHAMAVQNYATAAAELEASRWATQVQPRRKSRIVTMIATGIDPMGAV